MKSTRIDSGSDTHHEWFSEYPIHKVLKPMCHKTIKILSGRVDTKPNQPSAILGAETRDYV